jgi:FAD/FMN-containing dehydrogenase
MIDRRPELIARPLDVADVVSAVSYASAADLPIAVRGGGHSVAGHCMGDGALVIDLRLMRDVSVDPDTRTARAVVERSGRISTRRAFATGLRRRAEPSATRASPA